MRVLSLCAGVAGLDLGLRLALPSSRTVAFVEREAHAAAVLVARMQDGALDQAPVWPDLTTFDGGPWRGVVDLVAAGYPCQPFSFAGKRGGGDDPRHLWPHVARIIRESGATWAFLENVPGHLSLGFREVCGELQSMDFTVAAGVFSSTEVGAPHRRERLFALAHRHDDGHDGRVEEGDRREPQPEPAGGGQGVGHSNVAGLQGWIGPERGCTDQLLVRPPGPSGDWSFVPECLWPATVESRIRGVADGMASRVDRLRACGNGVDPLAAANAFRTLAAALAGFVR